MRISLSGLMVMLAAGIMGQSAWAEGTAENQQTSGPLHMHKRIHQGVESGELTRHERIRLNAEQRAIHRERKQDMKDGELSPQERRKLLRDKRHASRDIYRQKHDGQEASR